jgi:hypothetical protein
MMPNSYERVQKSCIFPLEGLKYGLLVVPK